MALGTSHLSARAVAPAACTVRWEPQAGIRAWDKERTMSWLLAQTEAAQLSDPKRSWWELLIFPPQCFYAPSLAAALCFGGVPMPKPSGKRPCFTFCQPNSICHFPPHATNTFLEAMHSRCSASQQLSSRLFVLLYTPCMMQPCSAQELRSTARSAAAQHCVAARGSRCRHGFGAGLLAGLSS